MSISFASFEPHPLPTTSQLFRSPGVPWTRRVSLPWPEAAAGTWKAGVAFLGWPLLLGERHRFCFHGRMGTRRPDPATSSCAAVTTSLGAHTCLLGTAAQSSSSAALGFKPFARAADRKLPPAGSPKGSSALLPTREHAGCIT